MSRSAKIEPSSIKKISEVTKYLKEVENSAIY